MHVITQFEASIKTLCTDNATEYFTVNSNKFISGYGTLHKFMCAYTPQQHCIPKQNYLLLELAHALSIHQQCSSLILGRLDQVSRVSLIIATLSKMEARKRENTAYARILFHHHEEVLLKSWLQLTAWVTIGPKFTSPNKELPIQDKLLSLLDSWRTQVDVKWASII